MIRNRPVYQDELTYLAALGGRVWLLVLVGAHTEVLDSFPGVPLAPEQDGVRASGCPCGELVDSQGFTASLKDALLSGSGEPEGGNGELGDVHKTDVVGDGGDGDDDLGITVGRARGLLHNARERDGRAVDLGEEQAVKDRLKRIVQ